LYVKTALKNIGWLLKITMLLTIMAGGCYVYGQNAKIAALQDSLALVTDPNIKVNILNAIAGEASEFDIDLSLATAHEARKLGLSEGYLHGVATANMWLGKGNALKGKTAESLHNLMDALKVYQNLADSLGMAHIYKYLANVYSANDNDREAMRYYKEAEEIYAALGAVEGISAILNNIGTIYLSFNKPDSALYYLNQSRLSYREIQDESGLATNYTNMGIAYALKGDYEKAVEHYMKSYKLASKINARETMSTSLLNVGDGYMNLGQFDKAEQNVKKGLAISEKEGYKNNTYIGYYTLGEIYEKRGDYKESLEWYHKAEDLFDELRSSAASRAMMDVQTMQLEQAQSREIERLNAINEERIQSEKFKNLIYLLLAIFALLALLGLTYYYMKRHKAALKIAMQNKEISSQKEQIELQSAKIKQVNSTLRERNKKLRELNEEKNYMMSVVAHDLKSPLNQINGLANVIKLDEQNLNETQKECLNNIDVASKRLSEMVNKILDSRNVDRKTDNLQIEPVDIDKMAGEVLKDFSNAAGNKKIVLNKNSNKNGTLVKADKHYLRQVLDNLVSNAIKFSPAGKKVALNIKDDDDKVLAEVIDEGPGISNEDKEKLFTEYAVLSAKPTGGETSTGLGLAIAKNYVEKMGGEIWCESDFGHGAVFKLKLERS
jgi:signal transduction histidine kinase